MQTKSIGRWRLYFLLPYHFLEWESFIDVCMPSSTKLGLPRRRRVNLFFYHHYSYCGFSGLVFNLHSVQPPLIGRSWLSSLSLIFDSRSAISHSSTMFVFSPVLHSLVILMPFMRIMRVFGISCSFFWILRWWIKYSVLKLSLDLDFQSISLWHQFSHWACLIFIDFLFLDDHVLLGKLSDCGVCLTIDDSHSFLETFPCVYFCRQLHDGFAFHMRCRWPQTLGIFACAYTHINHMALKLGFLCCFWLLFLHEKSFQPFAGCLHVNRGFIKDLLKCPAFWMAFILILLLCTVLIKWFRMASVKNEINPQFFNLDDTLEIQTQF